MNDLSIFPLILQGRLTKTITRICLNVATSANIKVYIVSNAFSFARKTKNQDNKKSGYFHLLHSFSIKRTQSLLPSPLSP